MYPRKVAWGRNRGRNPSYFPPRGLQRASSCLNGLRRLPPSSAASLPTQPPSSRPRSGLKCHRQPPPSSPGKDPRSCPAPPPHAPKPGAAPGCSQQRAPGLQNVASRARTRRKSPEKRGQEARPCLRLRGRARPALRKIKTSVPAIAGSSNMANRAIFTGAYLFWEDAGTDSTASFSSARRYAELGLSWLYLKASPPAHFS